MKHSIPTADAPENENKERAFAPSSRFHHGGEHAPRSFREVALRRELGPELRESLNCAQQPAEMVGLHGQDEWCENAEQVEGSMREL